MLTRFKLWLMARLQRCYRLLTPPTTRREADLESSLKILSDALADAYRREATGEIDQIGRIAELMEARQMAGAGPWKVSPVVAEETDRIITAAASAMKTGAPLREAIDSAGLSADIQLMLQNVEWRRETALFSNEFTRWGIQQIILIARLNYIKSALIQRGVNISAAYVWGRGFELSSDDETAQEALLEFQEHNKGTLGQIALSNLHRRLFYDGQIFFMLFADKQNTGMVNLRTVDATEIQEILPNPEDAEEPWLYKRTWSQRAENSEQEVKTAWYPALNYEPAGGRASTYRNDPIKWDSPIYHMRGGLSVSKWLFDVPLIFAAIEWAKTAETLLKACATVRQSLSRIAATLTTKGGQQAIAGAKQQVETHVGVGNVWDTNPPPNRASIFTAGAGTVLQAFNTKGAGGDPEDVRRFIHLVAIIFGLPETFFADATTGAHATAKSLDRPTELYMLEAQERWRETLVTIGKYVLSTSARAANGRLAASLDENQRKGLRIAEAPRRLEDGKLVYMREAKSDRAPEAAKILVRCTYPAIREGDVPAQVDAIVAAATLGKAGEFHGMDEKTTVRLLYEQFGVDNWEELLEEQYPTETYDPDRTAEPEPPPAPVVTMQPQLPGQPPAAALPEAPGDGKAREAFGRLLEAVRRRRNAA